MKFLLPKILFCRIALTASLVSGIFWTGAASGEGCGISLENDGAVLVQSEDGSSRRFEPRFVVLAGEFDPKLALRYPDLGDKRLKKLYNVESWATKVEAKTDGPKKAAGHVEDGFDPSVDLDAGSDRVFDAFKAAPQFPLVATHAEKQGSRIVWSFPDQALFTLRAFVELPAGQKEPVLTFEMTPKQASWFSVAYIGAPVSAPAAMDEMWQPLIWQEKRFPNQPYLTESGRCSLPTTLVTAGGVTTGVVADPVELPFMPMPTVANSRFGVAVRNAQGEAQSTLFAPILGGPGSHMEAGKPFSFKVRLFVAKGGVTESYKRLACGLYQFHDTRHNDGIGSLNKTLDRMVDYAMSKWARFNDDLRGAAYDTDVPGSVKNVSSLHPLAMAFVMDDPEIFELRARPMVEYSLSREKFLFTTDPNVKGQSASSKMAGPCAQVSELTALYGMTGGRDGFLLDMAKNLMGKTRTLNLSEPVRGDLWQNSLSYYASTGDTSWLQRAKQGADLYLKHRLETPATDFSDKNSRGMFFWTSFAPNWIELYSLYETTGDKRYLEAAHEGALRFAQFIWMCPTVPAGDVRVNESGEAPRYRVSDKFIPIKVAPETVPAWRLSEIGLTPEAAGTCKGHRAIFPAAYAAWMLRLSERTGDTFLRDIARSAIIGRYTSFPGYHINTARTTAYEKPDFAERPMAELNSTTSLHYNHIWPHIALVLDYLVSDVDARTKGAVSFPARFAEGYAYFQSKIYGDRPGKFHGEDAWLWMPKGLVTSDNPEVNYIAARGKDALYLALANQSAQPIKATLTLNSNLVIYQPGQTCAVQIWQDQQPAQTGTVKPGKIEVAIAPGGITSLAIRGISPQPRLQQRMQEPSAPWTKGYEKITFADTHAMVLDFGRDLQSAYVYLEARDGIAQATLHYSTGGEWKTMTGNAYPFEFTVPLAPDTREFSYKIETTGADGKIDESETAKLTR
ncbi:MAG: hypothetical protein ACFUZC_14485 [Chthoniobacteraceae bacterium]